MMTKKLLLRKIKSSMCYHRGVGNRSIIRNYTIQGRSPSLQEGEGEKGGTTHSCTPSTSLMQLFETLSAVHPKQDAHRLCLYLYCVFYRYLLVQCFLCINKKFFDFVSWWQRTNSQFLKSLKKQVSLSLKKLN